MAPSWIVLSTTWRLEDLQAGLNVIIALVSAFEIIVFARLTWQNGVQRLNKRPSVPISELFSVTTLGEVQDMALMLKGRLLSGKYFRLFFQCVVVILFTATAVLSGPISRYSTRRGQISKKNSVDGLMASTTNGCQYYATAAIDDTMIKLDRASFPADQLLDFLPDEKREWVYVPSEWNSTLSADCVYTGLTPVNLTATGNFTYDNGGQTEIMNELPQLWDIFSPEFKTNWFSIDWNLAGQTNDTERLWNEAILFVSATIQPDGEMNLTTSMRLAIAVVHLKDAPEANFTDNRSGSFAPGVIPKSSYKKVECEIRPTAAAQLRVQNTYGTQFYWRAYPDVFNTADPSCLSVQLTSNYLNSALKPSSISSDGWEVKLPSGEEMFRFYQAYLIVKDTYYPSPTRRTISVRYPTVEISAVFVTIMALAILIVGFGAVKYVCFFLRNPVGRRTLPQTKLEWVVQAIQEADGADRECYANNGGADTKPESEGIKCVRPTSIAQFEKATYSVATSGIYQSTNFGRFGKVNGIGVHAPAFLVSAESAESEDTQYKLGLLPFETRSL